MKPYRIRPYRRHELLELIHRQESVLGKTHSDELAQLRGLIMRDPSAPVGVWRLTLEGQQELARQRHALALAEQIESAYQGAA